MPDYFFEINDGSVVTRDDEAHPFDNRELMREAAIAALPDIAAPVLPNGDERTISILVRDGAQKSIFRAELTFHCTWLDG